MLLDGAESDRDVTTVGFLGAGQLGEPMVRRLLAAGQHTAVFARRDDVRARLRREGAVLANSIAELAESSDILISCLFSDAQLREAGLGPDGFISHARSGAVVISHTTGTPATLAELSESSALPPTIVDAPVSGTAQRIDDGTLTVLIGGPAHAIERVSPILAAYAGTIVPTGALGSALRVKLLNNVLFAANAQLLAAAVTVGERFGVAPATLLEALSVCSGGSYATGYALRKGIASFADNAGPFLRKDVAAALAAAEHHDVDLGLLRSVIQSGPLPLTEGT